MFKKVLSILVVVSALGLVLGGCAKEEDAAATDAAAPAADAPK